MSREVRRVPLDFDWPLNVVWSGYLIPAALDLPECPDCEGDGYSAFARHQQARWYGNDAFMPAETGSTPLTPATPAVRAFAERNVAHSPQFYGSDPSAITREAERLCRLWNGMWSHHLAQVDVDALVGGGRLMDFTHTWVKGDGWQPIVPVPVVTAEQVNLWSLNGFGHDSINCWVVVEAACKRAGEPYTCSRCEGTGDIGTAEQRAAAEAWEPTNPPTGDGWQLWETTTEGSPTTPVFATADELAHWIAGRRLGFAAAVVSLETAMAWVHGSGWSPSMIAVGGRLMDGITGVVELGGPS